MQLPGTRGPNDPDNPADDDGVGAFQAAGDSALLWDPRLDGCTGPVTAAAFGASAVDDCAGSRPLLHPNGQRFASEMAALSWNAMMVAVALSFADGQVDPDEFDPTNPFRTDARFDLSPGPGAAHAELRIYDAAGRLVAVPFSGRLQGGPRSFIWDGLDGRGQRVARGVYFYRLEVAPVADRAPGPADGGASAQVLHGKIVRR